MNPRKTVKLTRKDAEGNIGQAEVRLLYCAASETNFQAISGKTMEVFSPEFEKNDEGKYVVKALPTATDMDYIQLAMGCIAAAYDCDGEESPVKVEDLLFQASREELTALVETVLRMRNDWLQVPATVSPEIKDVKGKGKRKNA